MIGMAVAVLAAVWCGAILILLFGCKNKAGDYYSEYMDYIDKKEYSLKDMLPAGFYFAASGIKHKIIPKIVSRKLYKYNNSVTVKITELYGLEYTEFYMQVHNANKYVLSSVAAIVFALLAVVMGTGK